MGVFNRLCDEKSKQRIHPTDVDRRLPDDHIYVIGQVRKSQNSYIQRYTPLTDTWTEYLDLKNGIRPHMHHIGNHLYLILNERGTDVIKV